MPSELNSLYVPAPNVYVVRFHNNTIVASECVHLIPELIEASKRAPITLIASLPASTNSIHRSMVPFWLDQMLHKGLRVKAIGVATVSRAVKVVVSGFSMAMKLGNMPIQAQCAPTEAAIIEWAKSIEPVPGGGGAPPSNTPSFGSMPPPSSPGGTQMSTRF
ncbi:MAG: hypothetical protein JNM17_31610 [Archangium sp.]|nr:hypothetical protein [Archangium sp.]